MSNEDKTDNKGTKSNDNKGVEEEMPFDLSDKKCSFCGSSAIEVNRLISGAEGYICDRCVEVCHDMISKADVLDKEWDKESFPSPEQIKEFLDLYVIGQDVAKKAVAVAVYNHYKRIFSTPDMRKDIELDKSNILLMGPSGTGKTLIAQTLVKLLNVPFAIVDATVLTEAGYVGEDVENILVRLLQASDYNKKLAELGIVYIDELDKLARKNDNPSITRDVSGEGVQQALLKILEGTVAHVPPKGGRKHPEQDLIDINTRNILFICGGSFEGLERTIAKRVNKKFIGFDSDISREDVEFECDVLFKQTHPEDLINYGLIPEIVGRIPVNVSLEHLDRDALLHILTKPKNALVKQYKRLFEMDGVDLHFTQKALEAVVDKAMQRKTGARALRSIIEEAFRDIMFELPSREDIISCVITKEVITNDAEPNFKTIRSEKRA